MPLSGTERPQKSDRLTFLIFEAYGSGRIAGELRSVGYVLQFLDRRRFLPILAAPFRADPLEEIAAAHGVECSIVAPSPRLTQHGGRVLRASIWDRCLTVLALLKYTRTLFHMLRAKRVHLVCCWSLRAVLMVGLASRLACRPVLWIVNGELSNPILDLLGFLFASKIAFQCESNKRDRYPLLIRLLERKTALLPSGLDVSPPYADDARRTARLRRELGLRTDCVNVIVLGHLSPLKGTHLAIEAVGRLSTCEPNLSLYVVGDTMLDVHGEYKEELQHLVQRFRIEDRVHFTGWKSDATDIVAAMDILVHPSYSEGTPRAVLEAMALAKPVIATAVGCTRELVVDGQNGFLIERGDVHALVDRIARLARSPELRKRLGMAARQTVVATHGIDMHAKRFEGLITALAGRVA